MTDTTTDRASLDGALPPIDSARLSLPRQWVQVTAERGHIDRLFTETLSYIEDEGITLPRAEIRRLEASLGQLRRYLLDNGIAGLGLFAEVFLTEPETAETAETEGAETEAVRGEPFLASATMAIIHLDKARLGTEVSLSPKSLALLLSRTRPNEPEEHPAHRLTSLEPPEVIELPAGPATVLKQVMEYRPSVVESAKLFTQSYFISAPDEEGERVTLLQFSSPNVDLAPSLSRLFETIANTFVFLREGDESLPSGETSARP